MIGSIINILAGIALSAFTTNFDNKNLVIGALFVISFVDIIMLVLSEHMPKYLICIICILNIPAFILLGYALTR